MTDEDAPRAVLGEPRAGLRESVPALELSENSVRDRVVEVHALALSETQFRRIEDLPPSVPDSPQVGLPEAVVHCVPVHSCLAEGAFVLASVEATIVQYADAAFWTIREAGGHIAGVMDIVSVNRRG
jgi:hypothetical protein